MSQFEKLFEPGVIGGMRVRNRIISAPMERNYANPDGSVTQRYIDHLATKAAGGVGLIIVEATYVDPLGKGRVLELGIYDDRQIPAYARMAQAVHAQGAKIGLELVYGGRQSHSNVTGVQAHGPSQVTCNLPGYGELPRILSIDEIRVLVNKFGQAARRSKEAGFDMVELHCAHGYLIAQFMSPFANKRADEYGGSFEKRMRFPLEVIAAVRKAVGKDFPLATRLSGDEYIEGGLTNDDYVRIARMFEEAGVDLIDVSAGLYETAFSIVPPMGVRLGCNVHLAERIKSGVTIPVSIAGRINDAVFADSILKEGKVDFVSMARALHADPNFPRLSQQGKFEDICMCIGCNQGCIDTLGTMMPVYCVVNPLVGRERELALKPADHPKKVVVVGGGPGGLSAARVAALCGHKVTLYEKDNELGGQLRWARRAYKRGELEQCVRYLASQVRKAGVEVHLGSPMDKDSIHALKPDVVILATGAKPYRPFIPGSEQKHVCNYLEMLDGSVKPGKKVLVIGGKLVGAQVAHLVASQGGQAILTEPTPVICSDAGGRTKWVLLLEVQDNPRIEIRTNTSVEKIGPSSAILQSGGTYEEIQGIDTVVLCLGSSPENQLADELKWASRLPVIHTIGDCVVPRKMTEAIYEGYIIAMHL
jgi:2,4-dienoyl-CoA reductase-like NADH-dependent reductase (Old Yellow Enzyme family)/thioredoxin reductase